MVEPRSERLLLHVDAGSTGRGPVGPGPWGPGDEVRVLSPWPGERPTDLGAPAALHAVQRDARVLSRDLTSLRLDTGFVPEIHVLLDAHAVVAMDLGLRLAPWPVRLWTWCEEGWREVAQDIVTTPVVVGDSVEAPPDAGTAFVLGRRLAGLPRTRLVVVEAGSSEPLLALIGPPVHGRSPLRPGRAALDAAAERVVAGDEAGALDILRAAPVDGLDGSEVLLERARLAIRAGSAWRDDVQAVLAAVQADGRLRLRTARLLMAGGDAEEALRLLDAIVEEQPGYVAAVAARIEGLIEADRGEEAWAAWCASDGLRALGQGSSVDVRLRLAVVALRTGRLVEALEVVEGVLSDAPDNIHAIGMAARCEASIGRTAEGVARLRTACMRLAGRNGVEEVAADLGEVLLAHDEAEAALEVTSSALAQAPRHRRLVVLRARAGALLRDPRFPEWEAEIPVTDPVDVAAAFGRWVRYGDLVGAERVLEAHPEEPAAIALRSRLALWCADLDAAQALAQDALRRRPDQMVAETTLLAIEVLRGRAVGATIEGLTALVVRAGAGEGSDDVAEAELRAWKVAALRLVGRAADAWAEARSVLEASSLAYGPGVVMEGWRARVDAGEQPVLPRYDTAPHASWLGDLQPVPSLPEEGPAAVVAAELDRALTSLGGNRSVVPTRVVEGVLVRWFAAPSGRQRAVALQDMLRVWPIAEVVERVQGRVRASPSDPYLRVYGAEVLLWVGDHAEAERMLEPADRYDHGSVWAWVGLGAARLFLGRPDEALQTWATGVARLGRDMPALPVYRAEARLAVGDLEGAVDDLRVALRRVPDRLSAWLLLGVARARSGDASLAREVVESIVLQAPSFASGGTCPEEPVSWSEEALRRMAGNRARHAFGYPTSTGWWRSFAWRVGETWSDRWLGDAESLR